MFRSALTLDRANRVLTAVFGGLVVVAIAAAHALGSGTTRNAAWVVLGVMALSFMMAPRALVVENGQLRIERRLWPALTLPLADVESAAPIDSIGKKAARLFGVGGFFGSYGVFWSDKLGRFRLYATRRGQAVVVVRAGSLLPLVITPDDVAGAIDAIDPRARGAA